MAKEVLMQKGTALWLAKNTNLSNRQIAQFCNMHEIEVNAFRLGIHQNVSPVNPIDSFLLSEEMISECENDSKKNLESTQLEGKITTRKTRQYAKKHEIVNAIFWIINKYPNLPDEGVAKLLQCTKNLVQSIRTKEYKEYDSLTPRHPVIVELCSQENLEKMLAKYDISFV